MANCGRLGSYLLLASTVALLLAPTRAEFTIKDAYGQYRPFPRDAQRLECPTEVSVDPAKNNTAKITTDSDKCDPVDAALRRLYEGSPDVNKTIGNETNRSRGSGMTRALLRYDFDIVGFIVVANLIADVACDRGSQRNQLRRRRLLNFFRPETPMTEFGVSFQQKDDYLAFPKRGGYRCVYSRVKDGEPLEPVNSSTPKTNSSDKNSTPNTTDTIDSNVDEGIALWAWLGPLIGAAVLLFALLLAFCLRTRRDRWYPFAGQHEDISDAEFFGRVTQHHTDKTGVDRGPSGVVFERVDSAENDRPSSGEYGHDGKV